MTSPCLHYDCENKNSFGYCKTSACIHPKYGQQTVCGTYNATPRVVTKSTIKPQWIPCSERLREGVCQCIVTVKVKHIDDYSDYEVDTAVFADGIFTTANSWWGVENIIAWMPLPRPYKETEA